MALRFYKHGKFILFLLVLLVLIYMYFFSKHGFFALKRMQAKADSLSAVQDSLELVLKDLNQRIELLKQNHPEVIENEARRLGLARTGEEMIIVQIDSTASK